jgi:hypothetical protein
VAGGEPPHAALIPLGGFVWELIPEFTIYRWLGLGTFNPFGWTTTVLLAAALNAAVEVLALRWLFKASVTRRGSHRRTPSW